MKLLAAADRWCGVAYGHPRTRRDESVVDCSTLTARCLDAVLPGGLSTPAWLDVVVADGRRPWSPIERAVGDGWGQRLPVGAVGPVWSGAYLLQAWRSIPTNGHAMLVWAFPDGSLAVLEAANAEHADGEPYGVRWRGSRERGVAPLSLEDAPRLSVAELAADFRAGMGWARLSVE